MIPLKDDNPRSTYPLVTVSLIAVNVALFVHQLFMPQAEARAFIYQFGAVPALLIQGIHLYSPLTSMFLHGGLMHLLGNMLYLWIFGDNIEHLCGHFRFLVFYALCGLIAFLSHFFADPFSEIPMVGASGAISGVLGAYLLRFPRARVVVFLPIFFWIWYTFRVPAFLLLGLWFAVQILNGLTVPASAGGVAWFAHIGGFVAGLLLIRRFEKRRYRIST
jgi:membrane associated rhomboid family serine protease